MALVRREFELTDFESLDFSFTMDSLSEFMQEYAAVKSCASLTFHMDLLSKADSHAKIVSILLDMIQKKIMPDVAFFYTLFERVSLFCDLGCQAKVVSTAHANSMILTLEMYEDILNKLAIDESSKHTQLLPECCHMLRRLGVDIHYTYIDLLKTMSKIQGIDFAKPFCVLQMARNERYLPEKIYYCFFQCVYYAVNVDFNITAKILDEANRINVSDKRQLYVPVMHAAFNQAPLHDLLARKLLDDCNRLAPELLPPLTKKNDKYFVDLRYLFDYVGYYWLQILIAHISKNTKKPRKLVVIIGKHSEDNGLVDGYRAKMIDKLLANMGDSIKIQLAKTWNEGRRVFTIYPQLVNKSAPRQSMFSLESTTQILYRRHSSTAGTSKNQEEAVLVPVVQTQQIPIKQSSCIRFFSHPAVIATGITAATGAILYAVGLNV